MTLRTPSISLQGVATKTVVRFFKPSESDDLIDRKCGGNERRFVRISRLLIYTVLHAKYDISWKQFVQGLEAGDFS